MKEKLNLKTLTLIFIGTLILVGIGYGGYQLLNKEKPKENNNNTNQSTQSASTNYNSSVTDLGNGWMKYENKDYGLSFDVPDFWSKKLIEENIYENHQIDARLSLGKTCAESVKERVVNETKDYDYTKVPADCNYMIVEVSKEAPYFGITQQDWFNNLDKEEYIGAGTILSLEKIDIAQRKSWKVKLSFESNYYMIYVPNFDKGYIFSIFIMSEEGISSDITQIFLSSIKFE